MSDIEKNNTTTTAGAEDTGAGVVKLSAPFDYDGEKITEIPFDFDKVSSAAYLKIFDKTISAAPQMDPKIQLALFALASSMPKTELERLPMKDFLKILGEAQAFFLGAMLED